MKPTLNQKRIAAVVSALIAVLASFNLLKPEQALPITVLVTAVAALYMPQDDSK